MLFFRQVKFYCVDLLILTNLSYIITLVIIMAEINNVPQWILDSKTSVTEQNDEVGLIVAGYIGFFRKNGFSEKQIGLMLTTAFLLELPEVEKRVKAVLSCGEDSDKDKTRDLCAFLASRGVLFNNEESDPCEIIEIIKTKYGKTAAFETLLTFPEILTVWKKATVRGDEDYKKDKIKAENILKEVASVFSEI